MWLLDHFEIVLRPLKFLGLAPLISRKMKNIKFKRFLFVLPIVLSSTCSLSIASLLLIFPHFESHSSIHTIINFASLISFFLIIFTANCQSYCYKSVYQNIFYQIRQIEKRCAEKFWVKIPRKIKFHFLLKVVLVLFLFIISQALVFVEVLLTEAHVWSSFFTSLLRLIYPLAVLHVILFSDIVTMFILELNEQIRNSPTFVHSSSKFEFLKNVKLIHMDLWKLVVQINTFFGWNLLFLIINSFIYITYQLYWIFLALELKWNLLALIGMFRLKCVRMFHLAPMNFRLYSFDFLEQYSL